MTITLGTIAEFANMEDIEYITPVMAVERGQRQEARYLLRSFLRRVTSLHRLQSCGLPLGGPMTVRVRDGVHHYLGMSTCGSGWACPVCSAKIRYHRADEASKAVVAALNEGMTALFVTRTIPHTAEDTLSATLGLLAEGRRYVSNQTVIKGARAAAGYIGGIASKEITYGKRGWHPHTHDLEFYARPMTLKHFARLSGGYYDYLERYYALYGFPGLSREHGVRVEDVQLASGALAHYIAKLQEGAAIQLQTAHELARSDLKRGRSGSLMPFDLAYSFFATGDMDALDLWHEYERETFGRSVIRFTKGLRARLLAGEKEKTDEELAALKVGGSDVVRFSGWFYRKIAKVPGLEGKVLTALDTGGFGALVELLTVYHMDNPEGYEQITEEQNHE